MQLSRMEASDMLDVLHYYFEEDMTFTSEEQMKSQSKSRETIYESLYNREYKYKYVDKSANGRTYIEEPLDGVDEDEPPLKPFDPMGGPPKPFIPPTEMNPDAALPFGSVLDAPMG